MPVYSLGGSVVLWVNPLVLVSILQVSGNVISGLQELVKLIVIGWVVVQVLLDDGQALKLVNGVVVVSDLREGERLLVDVIGVHLELNVIKAVVMELFLNLEGGIEMLLAESDGELVQFLIHLLHKAGLFGLLLLLFSEDLGFSLSLGLGSLGLLGILLCFFLSSLLLSLLLCFFSSSLLFGLFLSLLLSSLLVSLSLLGSNLLLILLILELLDSVDLVLSEILGDPSLLHLSNLLGLHLLLDLKHLELSFSLSS